MAYSGNREQDDERAALLAELAGGGPVNQTQPAGAPVAFSPQPVATGPAAPTAPISGLPAAPATGPSPQAGGIMSRDERDQLRYSRPMAGFNTSNDYGGDLKARNSMKNTFGRLVQDFDQTPESFTPEELAQLMQTEKWKRAFPNARLLPGGKGDKVDFGGQLSDFEEGTPVGIVDAIMSAAPGQGTAGWIDEGNDGGGAPAGGMGGGLDALVGAGESLTSNDNLQQILQAIQALSEGKDPSREAMLAELAR